MSMLESLGVQPLARNSRHRQKTAAAMPRREALPLSRRAADETAALSLIMSATSSTIFDGFVKSNLVPAPGGRGLRGGGKNMQRYGRLSPPPQPSPVKGREIGTFYRFVIFVIIFYRRSGAGVCIWRGRPGFLPGLS